MNQQMKNNNRQVIKAAYDFFNKKLLQKDFNEDFNEEVELTRLKRLSQEYYLKKNTGVRSDL